LGYASLLKDETGGTAAKKVEMVVQSALRLRGLIEDMVNLRHVESRQADLNLEVISIQDVIEAVCADCRSLATAKGQTALLNLPSEPLQVKADPAKITLVLNNLLTNAIKFTPNGGRIALNVEPHGDEIWVSVADSGIGIPSADLERIFERFYQVEPHLTRRQGGMGLGLPIAKGMVELHGGRIWAESIERKGSRFTFTLPISGPNLAQ
jgi:two-component system sensor histidine kinase VicK